MTSTERRRLRMKFFYPTAVFCGIWTASLVYAQSPAKKEKKATTSGNTVKYADLVSGGKLPYGGNVTLTGQLGELQCGSKPISDVLNITAISVSYLGQTSQPTAGAITGNSWTASLGSLPADTAINLQLKIMGNIKDVKRSEIVSDLFADSAFLRNIKEFAAQSTNGAATTFNDAAGQVLTNISGKTGSLTTILESMLPSCAVVTDVTTAAVAGLRADKALIPLLSAPTRFHDVRTLLKNLKLDGFDPNMSPQDMRKFVQGLVSSGKYTKDGGQPLTKDDRDSVDQIFKLFTDSYDPVVAAFGGDVIAQLSQGVQLSQSSTTQDLNKYAGFDVGALYVPRISELREFNMVHIYPWGPVELDTSGKILFLERWSIAVGASFGDLSSNGSSRVKSDKAFVYGLGFRINKYFRVTAGGLVYRDAVGNRLLNEGFIGPSVDITALSALKQIFASSSSKKTQSSTPATTP